MSADAGVNTPAVVTSYALTPDGLATIEQLKADKLARAQALRADQHVQQAEILEREHRVEITAELYTQLDDKLLQPYEQYFTARADSTTISDKIPHEPMALILFARQSGQFDEIQVWTAKSGERRAVGVQRHNIAPEYTYFLIAGWHHEKLKTSEQIVAWCTDQDKRAARRNRAMRLMRTVGNGEKRARRPLLWAVGVSVVLASGNYLLSSCVLSATPSKPERHTSVFPVCDVVKGASHYALKTPSGLVLVPHRLHESAVRMSTIAYSTGKGGGGGSHGGHVKPEPMTLVSEPKPGYDYQINWTWANGERFATGIFQKGRTLKGGCE